MGLSPFIQLSYVVSGHGERRGRSWGFSSFLPSAVQSGALKQLYRIYSILGPHTCTYFDRYKRRIPAQWVASWCTIGLIKATSIANLTFSDGFSPTIYHLPWTCHGMFLLSTLHGA